ncbi:hypothetical protein PYCCODRAFT_1481440 [Trametes coccinea BRFM310]|uniref:Uncharacterized protein n=1 Tax=Trametes coccinea (strain BRFM310) TaxID=1353009 RepID=A0A1Y2I7S3_TRAC3|nr:hypothetical protein PYCCODRAFT_1481440 [Trametes coccinea BRFM310]
MPNSDDEDTSPEVDPAYLALYSENVEAFRAHLAGRDGQESLPASYFPPNAFWSAAEKDAFFHALAVHSRLRPDLIAEEVKTKTIPDICVYIALLEQATREASRKPLYVGAENKTVDHRIPRKDLPIAVEVSDEWIQQEEVGAEALAASEPVLERQSLLNERDSLIHSRRKSIRARKGQACTSSKDRDREGEKRRRKEFEAWLEEAQERWDAEDQWQFLDQTSLLALDRILRDDEDGRAVSNGEVDAEGGGMDLLFESTGLSTSPMLGNAPTSVGEELIDPQLLEISRPSSVAPAHSSPELGGSPEVTTQAEVSSPVLGTTLHFETTSSHQLSSHFQPSTPPFPPTTHPAEPNYIPALPQPAFSAPGPGSTAGDLEAEEDADVTQMSPMSRRRYQKRLYMRRKRAQATGVAVNENAVRLKPGRKPKPRPPPPPQDDAPRAKSRAAEESFSAALDPALSRSAQVQSDGQAEEHGGTGYRHPKVSGLTLPYRRQAQFAAIGIDAQRLHQEGVGLFHLQSIGKLMQTYNRLHDVPADVASQISVDTIKVLHDIVVEFVAEIMSRAIVSREQERIAKLQTKAWHMKENQNVSAANVKHALALYGADSLDKRAHFAGLLKKLDLEADADEQESVDGDGPPSPDTPLRSLQGTDAVSAGPDEGEDPENDSDPPLPPLSVLRMIFPPFFDLPRSTVLDNDGHKADAPDPAAYMPWPSSSLLSADAEPPREEELLPETIDEAALVAELLEDENIDKEDRLREVRDENALWVRFGGKKAAVSAPSAPHSEGDAGGTAEERPPVLPVGEKIARPRKRKRQPRGRSKSVTVEVSEDGAGSGVAGGGAEADGGSREGTVERRVRRKKGKGIAHLTEDQLRFMEPDPNGRIKSSVYVVDSD